MFDLLAETDIGLLQSILEGGLPLLLLIALCIVAKLYYKEKEDSKNDSVNHVKVVSDLKDTYSKKVETLLRERIESEADLQKTVMEAKDTMDAVVMIMTNVQQLLDDLAGEE